MTSKNYLSLYIIPSDLNTFGQEAKNLLEDLQMRNERMFLLTILIANLSDSKQKLDNNIFQTQSIGQKYNCPIRRLDYSQEQGFVSSLPLGLNQIEIDRGLTTSSTAIFVPFTTQELFQNGEALYYGINALSSNIIMADRKRLKNPKGLYCKGTGIPESTQATAPQAAQRTRGSKDRLSRAVYHQQPNMERGLISC